MLIYKLYPVPWLMQIICIFPPYNTSFKKTPFIFKLLRNNENIAEDRDYE